MKLNVIVEPKPVSPKLAVGQVYEQSNGYFAVMTSVNGYETNYLAFDSSGNLAGYRQARTSKLPKKSWWYVGKTELPTLEIALV